MVERTAALEGRDRESVRFGGMGLKEGARAGGGSSVADLPGEGGKASSQERSVGRRPEGDPPEMHLAGAGPSCASHFMTDTSNSLHG